MNKVVQDLQEQRDFLVENEWVGMNPLNVTTDRLVGCLVLRKEELDTLCVGLEATKCIAVALAEEGFPVTTDGHAGFSIGVINDRYLTKESQAIAILDRAIILAKEYFS